jgi:hypothetical protein
LQCYSFRPAPQNPASQAARGIHFRIGRKPPGTADRPKVLDVGSAI